MTDLPITQWLCVKGCGAVLNSRSVALHVCEQKQTPEAAGLPHGIEAFEEQIASLVANLEDPPKGLPPSDITPAQYYLNIINDFSKFIDRGTQFYGDGLPEAKDKIETALDHAYIEGYREAFRLMAIFFKDRVSIGITKSDILTEVEIHNEASRQAATFSTSGKNKLRIAYNAFRAGVEWANERVSK